MKLEIAVRWADALESGAFPQGREALRVTRYDDATGDVVGFAYCCLGVLCELSGLSEWDRDNKYLGHGSDLPTAVREWAGLVQQTGLPTLTKLSDDPRDSRTLAELNDADAEYEGVENVWDFPRIARLIRERWAEL